ncbi:hypothetical protein NDU88_004436 [Pleurodeles waltl]|uniref:Uncharacterized protein n=1 Tax=Pleurodeles waltl TaxID=8319 RepID=A0AAV7TR95_PLEWA|nr:hypothetical protein NDU88_004436 [Pleurodeles waltl]
MRVTLTSPEAANQSCPQRLVLGPHSHVTADVLLSSTDRRASRRKTAVKRQAPQPLGDQQPGSHTRSVGGSPIGSRQQLGAGLGLSTGGLVTTWATPTVGPMRPAGITGVQRAAPGGRDPGAGGLR